MTSRKLTPRKLLSMRIKADRTVAWWKQRELDTGKAIDSMTRAYCEGYADALAEVIRMAEGKR